METIHTGYVGVIERCQEPGLPLETGQALGFGGENVRQNLDGHVAVKGCIRGLPNHAHPAFADLFDEAGVGQVGVHAAYHGVAGDKIWRKL